MSKPLVALTLTPLLTPLLAACAASAGPVSTPPPAAAPVAGEPGLTLPTRPAVKNAPRSAVVHMLPGLEGVIGATPAELVRQFGPARLDSWEGDARKLQFSGERCVLDVYLYPKTRGAEPQATYVEARDADGKPLDRAGCVAALRPLPKPSPEPAPTSAPASAPRLKR